MKQKIAIIGGGVSGLTTGVMFGEHDFDVTILAAEIGQRTTSGAAAALWFPYDAAPADKVIPWALETHRVLVDLSRDRQSGVSMIELRQYSRTGQIEIPEWAQLLGGRCVSDVATDLRPVHGFTSGFAIDVPLMDTTIYLNYLADRFRAAGGKIQGGIELDKLEDVDPSLGLVINCAGMGARRLANDVDLQPHRGQVVIVPKIDRLSFALACDEMPLMYAIPREKDCVLGGTNDLSDNLEIDPASTSNIIAECRRVLNLSKLEILGERVGLRPFRKSGVRVERGRLSDGREVIHNYGHGGSGFTLSWGCAKSVLELLTLEAEH